MKELPESLRNTMNIVEETVRHQDNIDVVIKLYTAVIKSAYLSGQDSILIDIQKQQEIELRKPHRL